MRARMRELRLGSSVDHLGNVDMGSLIQPQHDVLFSTLTSLSIQCAYL